MKTVNSFLLIFCCSKYCMLLLTEGIWYFPFGDIYEELSIKRLGKEISQD